MRRLDLVNEVDDGEDESCEANANLNFSEGVAALSVNITLE